MISLQIYDNRYNFLVKPHVGDFLIRNKKCRFDVEKKRSSKVIDNVLELFLVNDEENQTVQLY